MPTYNDDTYNAYQMLGESMIGKHMVTADALNVRSTASSKAKIIDKMKEGTVINITKVNEYEEYCEIIYAYHNNLRKGFVSRNYLSGLFITDENFKGYMKIDNVEQNGLLQHRMKLVEITPLGRREIYDKTMHPRGWVALDILKPEGVDNLERVIKISSDDEESCSGFQSVSHLIQGPIYTSSLPDFSYLEEDMKGDSLFELQFPTDALGEPNKFVIVKGSAIEFEKGNYSNAKKVMSLDWDGRRLNHLNN